MADEYLRALDREAAAGDAESALRLALERERRDGAAAALSDAMRGLILRANGQRTFQVLRPTDLDDVVEVVLTGAIDWSKSFDTLTSAIRRGRPRRTDRRPRRILELDQRFQAHAWSFALATDTTSERLGATYALVVLLEEHVTVGAAAGPWEPPFQPYRAWPELGQKKSESWPDWCDRRISVYRTWAMTSASDRFRTSTEAARRWLLLKEHAESASRRPRRQRRDTRDPRRT